MHNLLGVATRPRAVLPHAAILVVLLAFAGFATSAQAQEASAASSSVEVTHSDGQAAPAEAVQCQGDLGGILESGLICTYCAQDNCGCISIDGCAISFSCTCSPIQCTRTCRILFCVP